jgi:tripartite ATP-independent transporter DctM subunit
MVSSVAIVLFSLLIITLIIGVPIGFALLAATIGSLAWASLPSSMACVRMIAGGKSFLLTAIPFFTLAGILMREGGITGRIIDFCMLFVGHMKGSLGHVNVVSSMIFGGISGSSVADTASVGNVLIPEMIKKKYSPAYSAAITAVSSTIGIIIPPSIPMIMYAMVAEVSIIKLFLAGAIPGVLIGILQMVVNSVLSKRNNYVANQERRSNFKEIIKGLKPGLLAIGMPILIVGSIMGGAVTATEASVLAVIYAFIVGKFVYKELSFKKLPAILTETVMTTGIVLLIVVASNAMSWILAYARIPQTVSEYLLQFSTNPVIILLIINVILLAAGAISDLAPNILILAPVFLPVIKMLGVDPIHFGVVMILNQAIALVTPPVGNCLYVCTKLADERVERVFTTGFPFMLANLTVLLLVTYIPQIAMWLPNLLVK